MQLSTTSRPALQVHAYELAALLLGSGGDRHYIIMSFFLANGGAGARGTG